MKCSTCGKQFKDWNALDKHHQENYKAMEDADSAAKKKGTLVGRYITEGMADGYAFYQIVKELKTKVKIRVILDIGRDNWVISYWGRETSIDKAYAQQDIYNRDNPLFESEPA